MNQDLVTRKQVASYFGVVPETVKNWEKKGIIKPHCVIGRSPRYNMKEVVETFSNSVNREGK